MSRLENEFTSQLCPRESLVISQVVPEEEEMDAVEEAIAASGPEVDFELGDFNALDEVNVIHALRTRRIEDWDHIDTILLLCEYL